MVPLLSLIQAAHQKPRSLTEAVPSQLTSQHTSKTQATLTLTTLQCGSTRRQGWQRLGGVIGWEGKGGLHTGLHLIGVRKTIAVTRTGSALEAAWADHSPWQTQAENLYKVPLLQHSPPAEATGLVQRDGKHTLKGNGVSGGPALRAATPANWDQVFPLIRQWWPLSRAHPTSQLAPALALRL